MNISIIRKISHGFLALSLVLVSSGVAGQSDPTKNALAKAQYMLRQVSAEKASLEAENRELKMQLEQAKTDYEALEAKSGAQQSASSDKIKRIKDRNGQLQDQLMALTEQKAKSDEHGKLLQEKLEVSRQNFDVCYQNNQELYDINGEILGKYQEKGFWSVLGQKEAFTSIQKVRVENLVQDYQYEMEDLKVNVVRDTEEAE